jgi:hypothetical protein
MRTGIETRPNEIVPDQIERGIKDVVPGTLIPNP